MIIYGIKVFNTVMGYYGDVCECPHCHSQYKNEILREKNFVHIMFIPLIPVKTRYYKICPRCMNRVEINKDEAKTLLAMPDNTGQKFNVYGVHRNQNNTYEIWTRDMKTNMDTCVINNLNKTQLNNFKKNSGHKDIVVNEA